MDPLIRAVAGGFNVGCRVETLKARLHTFDDATKIVRQRVRRRELVCPTCGYRVFLDHEPDRCPMCGREEWDLAPWRPFGSR